jgi:hypothetical protein
MEHGDTKILGILGILGTLDHLFLQGLIEPASKLQHLTVKKAIDFIRQHPKQLNHTPILERCIGHKPADAVVASGTSQFVQQYFTQALFLIRPADRKGNLGLIAHPLVWQV